MTELPGPSPASKEPSLEAAISRLAYPTRGNSLGGFICSTWRLGHGPGRSPGGIIVMATPRST